MAQPLSDARTNVRFNVMTLGEHCAGKAAFLRSLLLGDENTFTDCLESESYAKDIFRGQRLTDLKAPKVIKIVEVGRSCLKATNDHFISLVMYDTPGYEDFPYDKSLVDAICGRIEESHSAWRSLDLQALTAHDILDQDTRVHCVFFFLSAEGIKDIDLYFLAKLSGKVSIVPVIEEADFMTISKRNSYLGDLHTAIEKLSASLGKSAVYNFAGAGIGAVPRSKNRECDSLVETPATSKRRNSCHHVSGETSNESSAEKGIQTAARNVESFNAAETPPTNANDRQRSHTYSPSPEFTALISNAVDFDGSVASVSSDDRSFPHNMGTRSISIGSIETTENSNNLRHSIGISGQECGLPPSIDGAVSNSSAFSKNELHRLGEFSSSEDQSHSEIFFNQETFVNVGRALSDSAIYGDTPSTGSEDMVYCSHLNAVGPTFEDIEEDMEYEDWAEGDVSSIMMDSTVLIGLPRSRGGGSRPDVFGANSLKSDSHVTHATKTASDDVERNSSISLPPEVRICKIVSSLVCDAIADKKEQAACRIVSKIVCSHLPKTEYDIVAPHPTIPSKSSTEYLGEGHNENEAHAEANTNGGSAHEVSLDRDLSPARSERSMEGVDDHYFFEKAKSASAPAEHTESRTDGGGRSFEVNANGLHVYHNIFSISCSEVSRFLRSESADCGGAVQGTADKRSRGTTRNEEDSDNSDDVQSSRSASSWAPISSVDSLGSSILIDEEAHVGDADIRRLHGLLFEGQHALALIEQSKKFSLSLFPTRPSSIEMLHSTTTRCDVPQSRILSAGIFDSLSQYLDTITAPLLAFFAVIAERTCTSSQWITERTHRCLASTAASKINDRETAVKFGVRNIWIEAYENKHSSNTSTSTPPSVTTVTGSTAEVASAAQHNSVLSRKVLWLFVCNILMCALVWSGLKGRRVVRVVPTSSDKVVLAAAILDASKSLMIPSIISFSDVDEATIDMTEEYFDVLVNDAIIEAESLSIIADDIDTFDENDFTSRTSSVDVGEMSLVHCKSLHVGDIFECLTGLPMSINHGYNAPSLWGYTQQESSRRVGDASRTSSNWMARAADRRSSSASSSSEGSVSSETETSVNEETKPVDEDATDNNLPKLTQCRGIAHDDHDVLSACIEALSKYEIKNHEIVSYRVQNPIVTETQKQWDSYFLHCTKTNDYLRIIFQDAIKMIDDLLPNLIELWTSFIDQVEDTFKNTMAFLFSI